MDASAPSENLSDRPRILRQRSHTQSAAIKPTAQDNDVTRIDPDASKRHLAIRHRHTQSHHHIPHHPKRFAKEVLRLQNGSSSELSRHATKTSEGLTHGHPNQGTEARKDSMSGRTVEDTRAGTAAEESAFSVLARKVVNATAEERDRVVLKEQWKEKARQSELKAALNSLSEQSMQTTRRLDSLYYNLLEKISDLYSTINDLQELASLTTRLHRQFRAEGEDFASEVQQQIEGFGGFRTQQSRIQVLASRMDESKGKADGLSKRLETAKGRISALEERESEYQDSVSWRLRWLWIILSTIAGLVLLTWILHFSSQGVHRAVDRASDARTANTRSSDLQDLVEVPAPVKQSLAEIIGDDITGIDNGRWIYTPTVTSAEIRSATLRHSAVNPFDRIFDEL